MNTHQNLLFVCSKNRLRSPTAEIIFSAYPHLNALGCGLSSDAPTQIDGGLIEWADIIFVMEKKQLKRLTRLFKPALTDKQIICLHIPDRYQRMDPDLIPLLKQKVSKHIDLD